MALSCIHSHKLAYGCHLWLFPSLTPTSIRSLRPSDFIFFLFYDHCTRSGPHRTKTAILQPEWKSWIANVTCQPPDLSSSSWTNVLLLCSWTRSMSCMYLNRGLYTALWFNYLFIPLFGKAIRSLTLGMVFYLSLCSPVFSTVDTAQSINICWRMKYLYATTILMINLMGVN